MNDKKEEKIKSKKIEKTPEQIAKENQEKITIMPTMIDESEEKLEKKRDLSAIIPQANSDNYNNIENIDAVELISKDNTLKSDGSTSIATIDENGEIIMKANFTYPEQIDIEARKEEKSRKTKTKNKKEKPKITKTLQKFQNTTSLVSLMVIIILAALFYWYKTAPTELDFQPLTVRVELGDKLPIRTSSYVKPGKGKVDELLYALDTSKVVVEEAGEYEFTITYKGTNKTGKIIIEDTTEPVLKTRDVTIIEGDSFDASSFVEDCNDFSGCNYSFQDSDTEKKYTSPGMYTVYVVATDAYQNSVTKQANLYIEAEGITKVYTKESAFDFNTGYSVNERYELHFIEYPTYSLLLKGIYTQTFKYQDEIKYEAARKTYNGEPNYQCNDNDLTIVLNKTVNIIGSNYSRLTDIDTYLKKEGYTSR